jgi:hypothetical protein
MRSADRGVGRSVVELAGVSVTAILYQLVSLVAYQGCGISVYATMSR